MRPREAADQLWVTTQTVRDWLRAGRLRGRKGPSGRWEVEDASVEELRSELKRGTPRVDYRKGAQLFEAKVATLEAKVSEISQRAASMEFERDRFRAGALAARGAALELNAAQAVLERWVAATWRFQNDAPARWLSFGPQSVEEVGED